MSSSTNPKRSQIIEVVALALKRTSDQKYLLTRRGPGQSGAGDWEFPGGKVESGESQTQALQREIIEELGFSLDQNKFIFVAKNIHQYPSKVVHLFLWSCELKTIPNIILTEHDQIQWCSPSEMQDVGLSLGDLPFISQLK